MWAQMTDAPSFILPHASGGGEPRICAVEGVSAATLAAMLTPPPPCSAWFPSPAFAGEDKTILFSRRAPRPRLAYDHDNTTLLGSPRDYADALKLQLATGARIREVAGIRAAEVDPDTWRWTLPAARSKNGRPRVTPLVGLAREIVEMHVRVLIASANLGVSHPLQYF